MRRLGRIAVLVAAACGSALAMPGVAIGEAGLPNAGLDANDLHVSLSAPVVGLVDLSGVLEPSRDDGTYQNWTLTGDVASGDDVTLLWAAYGWQVPQLTSYYWSVDGTPIGEVVNPLYISISGSGMDDFNLAIVNPTSSMLNYDFLLVVDNTPLPPVSGATIDPGATVDLGEFSARGMYMYELDWATEDGAVAGVILGAAQIPEPVTLALAGAGLVLICGFARRRARRERH